MSDKIFLIATPTPHPRRGYGGRSDPTFVLLNMMYVAVAVHALPLLVSFAIFLAAPLGVRILIVACWAAYLSFVGMFVRAAYVDARKQPPPQS